MTKTQRNIATGLLLAPVTLFILIAFASAYSYAFTGDATWFFVENLDRWVNGFLVSWIPAAFVPLLTLHLD